MAKFMMSSESNSILSIVPSVVGEYNKTIQNAVEQQDVRATIISICSLKNVSKDALKVTIALIGETKASPDIVLCVSNAIQRYAETEDQQSQHIQQTLLMTLYKTTKSLHVLALLISSCSSVECLRVMIKMVNEISSGIASDRLQVYDALIKRLDEREIQEVIGVSEAETINKETRMRALKLAHEDRSLNISSIAFSSILLLLRSRKISSLDTWIALKPIQTLLATNSDMKQLVAIFQNGTVEDFVKFADAKKDFFFENGLIIDELMIKIRTLSLCSCKVGRFSISSLQTTLMAKSTSDVEAYIIDAIASGFIDATIDHSENVVHITRVSYRLLTQDTWMDMAKRLSTFRDSINSILMVHDQYNEQQ